MLRVGIAEAVAQWLEMMSSMPRITARTVAPLMPLVAPYIDLAVFFFDVTM